MSRIERVETEIKAMSTEELTQFRDWFAEFDAAAWDRQSSATSLPVNSTPWLRRRCTIIRLAALLSFET